MDKAPQWTFSHVGLFVIDLDQMAKYYKYVFSMVETDGGEARGHDVIFLSRDPREHHQLVLETSRISDETTVQQLSFRFNCLEDLRQMRDRIATKPSAFSEGEAQTYGVNHGNAWSLYSHDPEGNRIEMFVDSPFYVQQPRISGLDLSMTDEQILQETKARFDRDSSFRSKTDWSNDLARML